MKRIIISASAFLLAVASVSAQDVTDAQKAAEEAARKARFNQVDGVNNQTGTITYYFKLK